MIKLATIFIKKKILKELYSPPPPPPSENNLKQNDQET